MFEKQFEHHGIKYTRIGGWHLLSNSYILDREYKFKTNILGYSFDTLTYSMAPDGWCTAKVGFRWDGPSGPTIDTENFIRGSLIHDLLYRAIRALHLPAWIRPEADMLLYVICRSDGMSKFRAGYVYKGVADFAETSSLPEAPFNY